jgi:heme a synthase
VTTFDLLLLAFKGIAVASLPLSLVWLRRPTSRAGDRLRRLAWITAFFTFDLIVFGGFTRLTDSGLGCPDWPGCYAKANPFMASTDIRSAETAMPFGPVTMSKAWIEMIHRYLAMGVGLLIIAMLVVSVRRARVGKGPAHPRQVVALLLLVVVQGAFGAWTVTQRLQPIFVTTHLLLGLALFAALVWHALSLSSSPRAPRRASPLAWAALASAALLIVQIALGGWVSANYAVLACTEFPKCQGVWLPDMDFANGFHLWRPLGLAADGSYLSIAALTAIHWTHRGFALVVLIALGSLAIAVRRRPGLERTAIALLVVLSLQMVTGLVNVVFAWPLLAAVLHNAGAAGLVACLVVINYGLFQIGSGSRVNGLATTSPETRITPHRQRPV